jgi:hypothetical protein
LQGLSPTLIKIDVEGWEPEVLAGAVSTLRSPSLLGLIIEMNSDDAAFSTKELAVHDCMLATGFKPHFYDPLTRSVTLLPSKNPKAGNTIYLRNLDQVSALGFGTRFPGAFDSHLHRHLRMHSMHLADEI